MTGWHTCLWGELSTLEYGKSFRGYASSAGPYRVYGTNGPIGWHSEALCSYPSVIIGRKGAYRGVHYSATPFFAIDTAFYLKPKVELDTRWAYYELLTKDINGMDSGSAIPSTSREDFYGLTVQVPPLAEQRTIAHILGTLDDKIELNCRMNETLEEMARALFKDWFVDFGPVRAKMEGREPYLPPEVWSLFPDRLVDSELEPIPAGWEVKPLGDYVEIHDKLRIPLNSRQPRTQGKVSLLWRNTGIVDYVDGYLFDGVHILTGEDGSVVDEEGYPVVQYVWGQFWVNNHAHVLKGHRGFSDELSFTWANFGKPSKVSSFVTGAVQPKLNQKNLKSIPVLSSEQPVRRVFSDVVQPMFAKIRAISDQSMILAAQRDALLPKLVSGEIRVGKLKICAGEFTLTMTQEEFEAIIADDTKEVSENIVWTDDQDHSPAQEFRVEVNSATGHPIFIRWPVQSTVRKAVLLHDPPRHRENLRARPGRRPSQSRRYPCP